MANDREPGLLNHVNYAVRRSEASSVIAVVSLRCAVYRCLAWATAKRIQNGSRLSALLWTNGSQIWVQNDCWNVVLATIMAGESSVTRLFASLTSFCCLQDRQ
jgi:hypothetical protein